MNYTISSSGEPDPPPAPCRVLVRNGAFTDDGNAMPDEWQARVLAPVAYAERRRVGFTEYRQGQHEAAAIIATADARAPKRPYRPRRLMTKPRKAAAPRAPRTVRITGRGKDWAKNPNITLENIVAGQLRGLSMPAIAKEIGCHPNVLYVYLAEARRNDPAYAEAERQRQVCPKCGRPKRVPATICGICAKEAKRSGKRKAERAARKNRAVSATATQVASEASGVPCDTRNSPQGDLRATEAIL